MWSWFSWFSWNASPMWLRTGFSASRRLCVGSVPNSISAKTSSSSVVRSRSSIGDERRVRPAAELGVLAARCSRSCCVRPRIRPCRSYARVFEVSRR
jgi:hypothetical protein